MARQILPSLEVNPEGAKAKARGTLQLGAAWRVKLDVAAVEKLRGLTGSERLRLHYRKWRPPENRAEAAYAD